MKKLKTTALLCASLVLASASSFVSAEDFSRYTNQELEQQRLQLQNMSEADRTAYRNEMMNRMSSMSEDEQAQIRSRINETAGQGTTTRQRSMDGSSSGNQYGRGNSSGSGASGGQGMGGGRGKGR